MFVLLPVLVVVLLVWGALRSRLVDGFREAVLFASIGAGLFAVWDLELLNLFHLVGALYIAMSWAGCAVALFFWVRSISVVGIKANPREKNKSFTPAFGTGLAIVFAVSGIILITFIVAVTAPPNTWDAMTYHLPRVMHWLSERSLDFYPTDIPRQNNQLPGAEYLLLHVYALSGGDRCLNLLQWGALAGVAVSVSLIARHLGAGLVGQSVAALAAVSVPMAILQSTSCQNDLVVAFWMCAAVFFWLRSIRNGHWADMLVAAGAAGMAFLTKGTACVILPMFLAFAFICVRSGGWRGILKPLVTVMIVLVCVAGWGSRNVGNLRDAAGGTTIDEVLFKDYSWQCVLSNATKHVISECTVPLKPLMHICAKGIMRLHEKIGIAIDDPRTTQGPVSNMLLLSHALHEDYAGNLLHLLVLGGFVLAALWEGRSATRAYAVFIVVAAGMFVLLVKWQPWVNRLHLPIFLMAAPLVGIVLDRRTVWAGLLAGVLVLTAVPYILWNKSRPLSGEQNVFTVNREYQYFSNRPYLLRSYESAALEIENSGCSVVGLRTGGDSWEYPLWALSPKRVRFCQANRNGADKGCVPCLLVTVDQEMGAADIEQRGEMLLSSGNIRVFRLRQVIPAR